MKSKRILSALLSLLMAGNLAVQSVPAGAFSIETTQGEEQTLLTIPEGSILFEAEAETEPAEATPAETEGTAEKPGENTVSYTCGANTTWTFDLDSHVLTVSGSGEIRDFTYQSDAWFNYCDLVEEIVIQPGISTSSAVLRECRNVKRITMPLICQENGIAAFDNLFGGELPEGLTSVTLTDGAEVPAGYFLSCSGLTEITLPSTVAATK